MYVVLCYVQDSRKVYAGICGFILTIYEDAVIFLNLGQESLLEELRSGRMLISTTAA